MRDSTKQRFMYRGREGWRKREGKVENEEGGGGGNEEISPCYRLEFEDINKADREHRTCV